MTTVLEMSTHDLVLQLVCRVEHLTDIVESAREEIRHARHAVAVIADEAAHRKQAISMIAERLDTIDVEGCQHRRLAHHRDNGGAE